MHKYILIGILLLNLLVCVAQAEGLLFDGYIETGARSSDSGDGSAIIDDYVYHGYHLGLNQKVNPVFEYRISGFYYDKKYQDFGDLNNTSKALNSSVTYLLKDTKTDSLKLDVDLKYRQKRYENSPDAEYNQLRLAPEIKYEVKDIYAVGLAAGINNFNYLHREDENRIFGQISGKKYLLDKRLVLNSWFRIEDADEHQTLRSRIKTVINAGADYKARLVWLENIAGRIETGKGDTRDEDVEDTDLDYKYSQVNIRTEHKVLAEVETDLAWEYLQKEYLGSNLDFKSFSIANGWKYRFLSLDLGHKEVDYEILSNGNYRRETVGVGARYSQRMDWNARAGIEGNYYRYENGVNDKNRYKVIIGGEKVLTKQVRLGVELKWRLTDNEHKADERDAGIRIEAEIKY